MKRMCAFLLLGTMAAGQGAFAASITMNTPEVLPVLVQVDNQGKVTQVSPSVELKPSYDKLLRKTLDEMITQPANDHGQAVASQFVINLGMQAVPRSDGNYEARFVYVSTSPVPTGSWHWVRTDNRRLALMSQDVSPRQQRRSLPQQNTRRWDVSTNPASSTQGAAASSATHARPASQPRNQR